MARCSSCSAPLQVNSNHCRYCGVRNDMDFHGQHDYSAHSVASERTCPHCAIALEAIQLQLEQPLVVERCKTCFGLFFDLGELESLLDYSVTEVGSINHAYLNNINSDYYQTKQVVKYIKCPICQAFMRRTNFARKSGVIIDSCRHHGLWLDNGELQHLMEWKRVGGQLLHEHEQQQAKKPRKTDIDNSLGGTLQGAARQEGVDLETNLLDVLAFVAGKIF